MTVAPAAVDLRPRRSAHRAAPTTPVRLRRLSLVILGATLVAAVVSVLGAVAVTRSTERLRSRSGPARVAAQEVFSSVAEADAAATAAFLSGQTDDREQRRLYEDALARSAQQLTEVARLVADSAEGREAVQDLAARLTTYAGLIETARTLQHYGRSDPGVPTAQSALGQAISLARNDIGPDIDALTRLSQQRFDRDDGAGRPWLSAGLALGALVLVVLIATQVHVARVSRRLFNIPLLAASLLLIAGGIWLALALGRHAADLHAARVHGFDSITLTGEVQSTAYRARADESLALVGPAPGTSGSPAAASGSAAAPTTTLASRPVSPADVDAARNGTLASDAKGLLFDLARAANTSRERAAAAEVLVRWSRYDEQRAALRAAAEAGAGDQAVGIAVGPGSSTFNGFNVAVERVLADNQAESFEGLSAAQQRLRGLRAGTVAVPVLVALLALWGLQLRIDEYR